MGNSMIAPTSGVIPIPGQPQAQQSSMNPWSVNSALTQQIGLPGQQYQGGAVQAGDFTNVNGGGMFDDLFGNIGMEQLGQMGNIFGNVMGYFDKKDQMDLMKNQLNNQTKTGNYNMANNTNFTNGTIDAFGSGQAKSQNQFGSMA